MKIGFDVDGVLRTGQVGFLKFIDMYALAHGGWNDEVSEAYEMQRDSQCWPLLNPFIFAIEGDEIYAITNCIHQSTVDLKRRWVKFFFGDKIKYLTVSTGHGGWGKDYVDPVAKAKVELMLREGIEVYFDDDPAIIRVMRTLTDKIKFLKFGPWFEEVY